MNLLLTNVPYFILCIDILTVLLAIFHQHELNILTNVLRDFSVLSCAQLKISIEYNSNIFNTVAITIVGYFIISFLYIQLKLVQLKKFLFS